MLFIVSKIAWIVLIPANLMAICFVLWGLARWRSWNGLGNFMLGCALTLLIVCGILPVGPNALHYLESRYTRPAKLPPQIDGILVLGGAVDTHASVVSGRPEFNDGVDRVLAAMELAKTYPNAKIVFSGGSGLIRGNERTEAVDMKIFFKNNGFNISHVIYEDKSRTTYENIRNSFVKIHPKEKETWLLVTSAGHMMRAMQVGKRFLWRFTPYPVDYRAPGQYGVIPDNFDVLGNFYMSQLSLREAIGMGVYKLTGKMN